MSVLADRLSAAIAAWEERAGRKLIPAQFAREINASRQRVNDWLHGRGKSMNGENAARAAIFLGVNPLWLAAGEGEMYAENVLGQISKHEIALITAYRLLDVKDKWMLRGMAEKLLESMVDDPLGTPEEIAALKAALNALINNHTG